MTYMETSAKTANNVEDTFMLVASQIKAKCAEPWPYRCTAPPASVSSSHRPLPLSCLSPPPLPRSPPSPLASSPPLPPHRHWYASPPWLVPCSQGGAGQKAGGGGGDQGGGPGGRCPTEEGVLLVRRREGGVAQFDWMTELKGIKL